MKDLNGARALTPAQFAAEHPAEADAARRKQAERDRQAEQDAAQAVLERLDNEDLDIEMLTTLFPPTAEPDGPTLQQSLRMQAADLRRRGTDAQEIRLALGRTLHARRPLLPTRRQYSERRPQTWVIPGWLPEREVGVLAARGNTGKSYLTLQLCYALASGEGWELLGFADTPLPEPAPVLLANWEDPRDVVDDRLDWLEKLLCDHNPNRTRRREAPANLHILDGDELRRRGSMWGRGYNMQSMGERLAAWHAVLEGAAAVKPKLLVLDPLTAAYAANEIERAQVWEFVNALYLWARDTNCSVLLLSHPPKGEQKGSGEGDINPDRVLSGSTGWFGSFRTVWYLQPAADTEPGHHWHLWHCLKQNYGSRPDPVPMQRTAKGLWQADAKGYTDTLAAKNAKDGQPRSRQKTQAPGRSFLTDLEME